MSKMTNKKVVQNHGEGNFKGTFTASFNRFGMKYAESFKTEELAEAWIARREAPPR